MLTILGALLALWHHFWAQFGHLGVTFGAFWMHLLHQKTDWGAKGAQRGKTPEIKSPFWTHFGVNFFDFSCIFSKKSCVLHMLVFSMNFGSHWVLFGIGSHAIRPRICSPNTLFSFCIFSYKGSLKTLKLVNFWVIFEK